MLLLASGVSSVFAGDGPPISRIDRSRHADIRQRIELHRQKLPPDAQRRRNFAWASAEIEGVAKREYFAHSSIQNLDSLSGEAAARVRGISLIPDKPVFETLCVNRKGEVDGPDCWNRRVDTEFKILEDIAAQLGGRTNAAGHITLYTDLPPCKSCVHVMRQFMAKYPNIKLDVLYRD